MSKRSYDKLIRRIEALSALGVRVNTIGRFEARGTVYPIFVIEMGDFAQNRTRVLIASGIHGDEPAGVEAALSFVEQNASNRDILDHFSLVIYPCNNPTGWELNTRENWRGTDLNRQFGLRRQEDEVEIIAQSLQGQCYDLVFEMHEDIDSPGFYLYEIAEDVSYHVGEQIIESVRAMGYPINLDECIEGMSAVGGLIRRRSFRFPRRGVPQAIYIYRKCGGHVLTLEPPASVLAVEDRVRILLRGLEVALASVS